jgi:3-oxoadipate enol-lactonase
MSSAFVDVNGARLCFSIAGAGTPVVLLHGFGLDLQMWDTQVAALAVRHRVIRYDLRGYGRSSLPTAQPYAHEDDLDALLGLLAARPAHVVGLSNGGRIAARFALRHPSAVRSLTLVDSALDGHPWSSEWLALWSTITSTAAAGDLEGAKRLWLAHPLFAPAREQPAVAAALQAAVRRYSAWHWANADPGRAPAVPTIQSLAAIQAATLVVVGERDLPDFQRVADTLASAIPGAERVVLPGVGHLANMEAPARFNDLLLNFLS